MPTSAVRRFPATRIGLALAGRFVGAWVSLEVGEQDPRQMSLCAYATTAVTDMTAYLIPLAHTDVEVRVSYSERAVELSVSAETDGSVAHLPTQFRNLESLSLRWGMDADRAGRSTLWCVLPV